MLLYQIIHLESGLKYIGQTSRAPIKRWREHLYALRKNKHDNRYLQSAWNKHGESAFKFEIIKEYNTLQELNQAEIDVIKSGTDLFNLSEGGNGYRHLSDSKKAIGESNKIPIVGMNIKTGETKEWPSAADAAKDGFDPGRIRKCVTGFVTKRKDGTEFHSISHKGWIWLSKELATSDALKAKCDIAKVAKAHKERPVLGMNIFTKQTVQFKSASEAGRNGFKASTVHRACNSDAIHKGFVWTYGDIESPQSLLEDKANRAVSVVKRGPKSWA